MGLSNKMMLRQTHIFYIILAKILALLLSFIVFSEYIFTKFFCNQEAHFLHGVKPRLTASSNVVGVYVPPLQLLS